MKTIFLSLVFLYLIPAIILTVIARKNPSNTKSGRVMDMVLCWLPLLNITGVALYLEEKMTVYLKKEEDHA